MSQSHLSELGRGAAFEERLGEVGPAAHGDLSDSLSDAKTQRVATLNLLRICDVSFPGKNKRKQPCPVLIDSLYNPTGENDKLSLAHGRQNKQTQTLLNNQTPFVCSYLLWWRNAWNPLGELSFDCATHVQRREFIEGPFADII